MGSKGAKAIGEMLLDNTNLRRVNLSGEFVKKALKVMMRVMMIRLK